MQVSVRLENALRDNAAEQVFIDWLNKKSLHYSSHLKPAN
jgi:hypothetical protein